MKSTADTLRDLLLKGTVPSAYAASGFGQKFSYKLLRASRECRAFYIAALHELHDRDSALQCCQAWFLLEFEELVGQSDLEGMIAAAFRFLDQETRACQLSRTMPYRFLLLEGLLRRAGIDA